MTNTNPSIRIDVDTSNPGQFFACCGLLELADRLWDGAEGWFDRECFNISMNGSLVSLIEAVSTAELTQLDPGNATSSPIQFGAPFRSLRLDWWQDEDAGGKALKVWAGSMESYGIAKAMQHAMRSEKFHFPCLFDIGMIVYDPNDMRKKKEPFYFDARRGLNAHPRDVGFSLNALEMNTTAFPAVELLCLVGLQRCLPAKTNRLRVFDYFTWATPLPPELLPPVVAGEFPLFKPRGYQFENWYRTGQKKHKAFRSAIPIQHKRQTRGADHE
ncbi:MAG: hypothetical protein WCH61_01095 [bacterium]